jgi:hypothetical protein
LIVANTSGWMGRGKKDGEDGMGESLQWNANNVIKDQLVGAHVVHIKAHPRNENVFKLLSTKIQIKLKKEFESKINFDLKQNVNIYLFEVFIKLLNDISHKNTATFELV